MRLSDAFLKKERLEDATAWLDLYGIKFKVALATNKKYVDAIEAIKDKGFSSKEENNKYLEAISNYIILDWSNLENDDGEELQPTLENKIWVLDSYSGIVFKILDFASDPHNFIKNNFEEELGN
jgi:hypothetical protein